MSQKRKSSQLTPKGTEGTMSAADSKATSSESSATPSKHQRRASQVFAASTQQKSTVIPAQQKLRLEVETGSWQFNHWIQFGDQQQLRRRSQER